MFKTYQIKWYFILAGILAATTTLSLALRHEGHNSVSWLEYPQYAMQVLITIFVSWMIHGYFVIHKFSWLSNYSKHFVSNVTATLATFIAAYLLYLLLPKTTFNDSNMRYDTTSNIIIHFLGAFLASIVSYQRITQ